MLNRALALGVSVFFFGACQEAGPPSGAAGSPTGPSSLAATSVTRPWKARVNWSVKGVQWAGIPGLAKSLFDGRCSLLSDYVVSGAFEGEATHAGRITGETEHCTQITWSPDGQPLAATYSDGRANMVAADGSRLLMRYGNGATGLDTATGETWFRDDFTLFGETERFEGATGAGQEGGRFLDFAAVLAGAPVPMWMDGTITYSSARTER